MSESRSGFHGPTAFAVGLIVVGFASVGALGCGSSSVSGGPHDAGSDSATIHPTREAGTGGDAATAGGDAATSMYDNTVGNTCKADSDCQPAGGPGLAVCSSSLGSGGLFPTPVCVIPTCNPGTDGFAHFCDGPDQPGSPGFCLAVGTAGQGFCLPSCVAFSDGTSPQGCSGKNYCVVAAFATDTTTNQPVGLGYCFGGCTADADCPTGNHCQTNEGICLPTVTAPTKAIGQACTSADNSTATAPAACDCLLNSNTNNGYCSQSCVVGSTTNPCPAGYLCDSFLPTQLVDSTGATFPGFTTQNPSLLGTCAAICTTPDASTGCPATSTCTNFETAGDDCLP
jgi:hypothetical protein